MLACGSDSRLRAKGERSRRVSFLDQIAELYGPVEHVRLRRTPSGAQGFLQDSINMRRYFNTAVLQVSLSAERRDDRKG